MSMDQNQIIEKIKKCFALSESSNENEAALAMQKAQELMSKYDVKHVDIEMSYVNSKESKVSKTAKPPRYLVFLCWVIAEVFGCQVIISKKYEVSAYRSYPVSYIRFIGFGPNAEIAAYAFDVLSKKLIKGRKDYLKSMRLFKRSTMTRRADLWAEAWVEGACSKVSPMVVGKKEKEIIEAYKSKEYGELKEHQTKKLPDIKPGDSRAIQDGYLSGKDVDIHHGVSGSSKTMMIQ